MFNINSLLVLCYAPFLCSHWPLYGCNLFGYIAPKIFNYLAFRSFDFQRTWWMSFQKRAMCTKFDIYFIFTIMPIELVIFYATFDQNHFNHLRHYLLHIQRCTMNMEHMYFCLPFSKFMSHCNISFYCHFYFGIYLRSFSLAFRWKVIICLRLGENITRSGFYDWK